MSIQTGRRRFLGVAAAMAACASLPRPESGASSSRARRFRAVVFDGLALLDTLSIDRLAEHLFPERGTELAGVWRAKSLEYQWLSALSRQRADFWQCTDAALRHAARVLKLELSGERRDRLLGAWLELRAWADVPPVLRALKLQGQRLAPLANLSASILDAGIEASALGGLFDEVLSTERVRTFKPDPRAYALALEALGVSRDEALFVPSASWDALGATWFGYATYWVNRSGAVDDALGTAVTAATGMEGLPRFVAADGSRPERETREGLHERAVP